MNYVIVPDFLFYTDFIPDNEFYFVKLMAPVIAASRSSTIKLIISIQ